MATRRGFIGAAGVMTAGLLTKPSILFGSVPKAAYDMNKVKITDVKTAAVIIKKYKTHLIKITTDSGLYGLGEAFPKSEVEQDIHTIKREIIGEDPLQVEVLHQKLSDKFVSRGSRTGALCGAISGIEIALWDLAGKILNVPVYTLLGGNYRDNILIYHDMDSPEGMDPKAWADMALKSREFGFKAIKLSLPKKSGEKWNRSLTAQDSKAWIRILESTRKALGDDFPLGVDLHWKYDSVNALKFIKMAEPLNLWFLEDPIPPENADAFRKLTMESKIPGDLLYVLGGTKNELGASEYYDHLGYVGANVPQVHTEDFSKLYRVLSKVVKEELVASVHGVYRGGLGIHLAMIAMGGDLGFEIDLGAVPSDDLDCDDKVLFSESPGRFIVTIDPENKDTFEAMFSDLPYACIGKIIDSPHILINGLNGKTVISLSIDKLKTAWKRPFGELI